MATPPATSGAPSLNKIGPESSVHVAAALSTLVVLNSNAKTVTNSSTNPNTVASGSDASHANVVRIGVPTNATYLDIMTEWVGSNPVTLNKVRVFGTCPAIGAGGEKTYPFDYSQSVFTVRTDPEWIPLGHLATNDFLVTVGDASDLTCWTNGTSKRTKPITINCIAAGEVMVVIDTASDAGTAAMIVGYFGK